MVSKTITKMIKNNLIVQEEKKPLKSHLQLLNLPLQLLQEEEKEKILGNLEVNFFLFSLQYSINLIELPESPTL